jgi:membrane-bound metal-dependent hydrolase YbcI (DUF457 family)
MPSPITHIAAGYAIYTFVHKRFPPYKLGKILRVSGLFLLIVGLALLPDIDSVVGLVTGDFGRYHNQGSHSLITGLGVALVIAAAIRWRQKGSFRVWFFTALTAYESHVILDYFTYGRGVKLFWPISPERFTSSVLLFYGLHWSDGLFSINHVWTVLTEVGLILLVYVGVKGFQKLQGRKNKRSQLNSLKEEYVDERTRID